MNNFDLIEHIHMRLPLWSHNDKTDIITREELWDEVAQIMNCSKDLLKSRWKNLRDSYRKILRKSDGKDGDPKWPYFNAMEFMREITINAKPKVFDITKKPPIIEPHYMLTLEKSENEDSNDALQDGFKQEHGVKRLAAEDLVTQFLEIESEKTQGDSSLEKTVRHLYEEDDDYQFLLSLHPHFKQVPLNRKLPLRMKIEQLIYDELYTQLPSTPDCTF